MTPKPVQAILFFLQLLLVSCIGRSNDLEKEVQTLRLEYIAWACDCANWATPADITKYYNAEGDSLADLSCFIEPADSSLVLPDSFHANGYIVEFTGQYYVKKGFPKSYRSIEFPDKAKVFRYTKFKVIRRRDS